WGEMPRSPGHVFYDRLQEVLIAGGFDLFVETACQPYYAPKMGAPSLPPGRYFRMHMVGYFEGIASERGIAWRCSDSMSLRDFLRLESREQVPDHSWLSKTRGRLPREVHERVFGWVLKLVAEHSLVKGKRIGVDASTMEANAALRTIVRREDGRTYREMLRRMAQESGIDTPTADDLVRIDRNRKGKKLSNDEWTSKTDPEAKIAKLKDGRTHLAYKPEHAVDLGTGIVVAAARENVHKRYLVHVAGHNLGILMRLLVGAGTPREAAGRPLACLLFVYADEAVTIILVAARPDRFAILVLAVTAYPA